MQKLISKYGLAVHLAIVTVAVVCLQTSAVLWLSALGAIWLVMEPSRIGSETLRDARRRVSRAIVTDSLFWTLLVLVSSSLLRMFNTGIFMTYDAEVGRWLMTEATFPLLPGSVRGAGLGSVGASVAALVVVTGCRNCLGRSARGAYVLTASTLSGISALVQGFWMQEGVRSVIRKTLCPLTQSSYAGCVYGVFLVFAIVALAAAFESRWLKAMPLTFVAIGGNLLGLFMFAPTVVSLAHLAAAFIVFAYAFVYLRLHLGKTAEFKFLVFVGMGIALAFLAVEGFLPSSFIESRIEPILSASFVPKGFVELRTSLSGLCARVWKENPWLGTGLGTFRIDLRFFATAADWQVVPTLQRGVPNGYWLLLAERGVVGAFLLGGPIVILVGTYLIRLVRGVRLALPQPLAWAAFPVFVVAALETLVDSSFLSPGPAVALLAVMALSAAAFPKEKKSNV